jgi:hypothetical protein
VTFSSLISEKRENVVVFFAVWVLFEKQDLVILYDDMVIDDGGCLLA